jgi:16S rRNA (adenine1518-N6/adenine1519-N6)-dimethyltransferase
VSHRPRKRFGQHFLAPAWADKVVGAIQPKRTDRFLEIGPGPGILTSRLAPRVASLIAIEIDRDLAAGLRAGLPPNALVVDGDFLKLDLSPFLRDAPLRVAGNLPYNISSPILFKLLATASQSPLLIDATVMLQLEVADRLAAKPGTKDYGVLTILATTQADVTRLLTLPPGAFRPAPRVHSAVVRLTFKPSVVGPDIASVFEPMVKTMFMQRRKTLSNALRSYADRVGLDAATVLRTSEIDPARRPETLTQSELLRLAQTLKPKA